MAGTIRGRIDCLTSVASSGSAARDAVRSRQEVFRTIWAFLDAHPSCTRIASNYGLSAAGTMNPASNVRGLGYWDEASNLGHSAFGVWRFNNAFWPWYLFLEFDGADTGNNINGAATTATSSGIGIQAAFGVTSGGAAGNPWNGGTANAGADAKGTPRWVAPSGGSLFVLPRANEASGSFATNRNNSSPLHIVNPNLSGSVVAFGCAADDDSFVAWFDNANANIWHAGGVVRVIPSPGITLPRPYAMINDTALAWTQVGTSPTVYGLTAGTGARDGGILVPSTASGNNGRSVYIERVANVNVRTDHNPGNVTGTSLYPEWDILVGALETAATPSAIAGVLGKLDPAMIREVYNVGSMDTPVNLSRAFLGGSVSLTTLKLSVPWNGVTTPRTYASGRAGVSF